MHHHFNQILHGNPHPHPWQNPNMQFWPIPQQSDMLCVPIFSWTDDVCSMLVVEDVEVGTSCVDWMLEGWDLQSISQLQYSAHTPKKYYLLISYSTLLLLYVCSVSERIFSKKSNWGDSCAHDAQEGSSQLFVNSKWIHCPSCLVLVIINMMLSWRIFSFCGILWGDIIQIWNFYDKKTHDKEYFLSFVVVSKWRGHHMHRQ